MTILTPTRLGKLQQDVNFDINWDLSKKLVGSFGSCILLSLCLGQKISVWRCFLVKLLSYLWNVFFFCWFCVPTSLPLYDCRLPSVRNWYFSPSIKTILNLALPGFKMFWFRVLRLVGEYILKDFSDENIKLKKKFIMYTTTDWPFLLQNNISEDAKLSRTKNPKCQAELNRLKFNMIKLSWKK